MNNEVAAQQSTVGIKRCTSCGADVSQLKRWKDTEGRYYCDSCWTKKNNPPAMPMHVRLLNKVICPHCWHVFIPEEILWIAEHPDLIGDSILGPEQNARFLPTRFTVQGKAIDSRNVVCHRMACPRCHLFIAREVIESPLLFVSMIGGPASGKSNFLAAMTWQLRQLLPQKFFLQWSDVDALTNRLVNSNEEQLFLTGDPDGLTYIAKTQEQGDIYDILNIGGQSTALTRPFLFAIKPTLSHPRAARSAEISRLLCLYDNAGESYLPGADTPARPYTQHLGKAQLVLFLLDPTQDPRMRQRCQGISTDPQLTALGRIYRQEILLQEAGMRIRRYSGLTPNARYERPFIVAVSKSDIWGKLIDEDIQTDPYLPGKSDGRYVVDVARIERVSNKIRQMLMSVTPEIVASAESISTHVLFVPISSLGRAPESHPALPNVLAIRPRDITPHWVTVPILYSLVKWTTGLVAVATPQRN
ncbi:MAG TPA: hypothetical protein VMG59_10505 [Phycisphaerae bacterium]|nr:hypothetical protein [Phycisphaerae bacterium]